jgi:hypothetical protein
MNTQPQILVGRNQLLLINLASWQKIIMVVNSIDPLAPYKAFVDLVLDLLNVSAIMKNDPEDTGAAPCRVEIVEPYNLAIHKPPGVHARQSAKFK